MLKIFTKSEYLTNEYRKWMFPLLLDLSFLKHDLFEDYYELVQTLDECDIAIFPININNLYLLKKKTELSNFISEAKKKNKPIWVFSGGDYGLTLPDKEVYVFRLGGFHSKMNKRSFIFPSFIVDPLEHNLKKEFKPLSVTSQPEIGFVGHAKGDILKYIEEVFIYLLVNFQRAVGKRIADYQAFYPSGYLRAKYLNILLKDDSVQCNFIFRKKYRGGATNAADKEKTAQEFFENIYHNLYTFCIRGMGNFSVRFYETLAMGRIPVLIDTDGRLPLHDSIDWSKHALIIDETAIKELPKLLKEFHENLSEEEILKFQRDNRQLWEEKLNRIGYFKEIHNIFTAT